MYGTAQNVAAMATTWSEGGEFTDGDAYDEASSPSLAQVNIWLEQFSNVVDLALRNEGFSTPLTDPTAVGAVTPIVEGVVADMVNWSHKAGRFYTKKAVEYGVSPIRAITKELNAWVSENLVALQNSGVKSTANSSGRHIASLDVM